MNPYLEIIRPANGAMAAVAVLVGYIVAIGSVAITLPAAAAMLSAFLILSGGMAVNDYYDVAIDKKNKPHRPIPSGRMRRTRAFQYSMALFGLGLAAALYVSYAAFAIATAAAMLLYLYAWKFSAEPFTGNLVVAVNTGLTFIFGAAAAGEVLSIPAIALAGMALFATLAREIYKSIQDMKADKGHRETLPMHIGIGKSSLIAAFALATAVMLSPIPYWAGTLSTKYILLIALVDAGFLYTAFNGMYSRNHAKEAYYCKIFQAAALIAFVAGVF